MVWVIDTCDSCTDLTLCRNYQHEGETFVWCDNCADESATIIPFNQ